MIIPIKVFLKFLTSQPWENCLLYAQTILCTIISIFTYPECTVHKSSLCIPSPKQSAQHRVVIKWKFKRKWMIECRKTASLELKTSASNLNTCLSHSSLLTSLPSIPWPPPLPTATNQTAPFCKSPWQQSLVQVHNRKNIQPCWEGTNNSQPQDKWPHMGPLKSRKFPWQDGLCACRPQGAGCRRRRPSPAMTVEKAPSYLILA